MTAQETAAQQEYEEWGGDGEMGRMMATQDKTTHHDRAVI